MRKTRVKQLRKQHPAAEGAQWERPNSRRSDYHTAIYGSNLRLVAESRFRRVKKDYKSAKAANVL